ncbi:proton-conducting transporter membrane subunit [Ancylomarina sp. 16SWW S1-10-2]|uniref:proton-conducting transporter transmembrane domain-containing protein n=1 Tax=Ancylomarina sp. 16SWW S1-10-2 TaxID=2499681 RepID=UPI0012AD5079|nr:proton-conducting transporter membrane subunit [Ancylomarina sp. 16SWW S1-10-2]MRT92247.1 NADH-quinone oxidoreductase subunit E [Ancylomarina sp. 16SWW S1-10-2]
MTIILFKIVIIFALVLFMLPKQYQYYLGLVLHIAIISISSSWAINALAISSKVTLPFIPFLGNILSIEIDQLSAFFILVINMTMLTGIIYAKGYLQAYFHKKSKTEMAWHFFNFLWLHISMLLVVSLRDAIAFLMIWEVMSLSSFFLVIFETEKKETISIGIKYLIQMHIGVIFLMVAFIFAYVQTGAAFSFNGLSIYFASHNPFGLFLIFFIGFGIKAGFIPLHSWLPHAHPAAPSHVSAVMSGVMIKMGIYGILRVLMSIHHDLFNIGLFILIMSLISGLLGVSMAIVQHDVKKLLAYHSIENIGIIGIGIGLGVIGIAEDIPVLAALGFAGGILHILNHSLFKSLLFYTAGSVYKQTHTRNIEELGGLIKKMPKTALFFLLGALAISGLPPFNGFISEFLIYSGIFKSLHSANLFTDIVLMFSFTSLAIIGGLALFCFTKVFSVIFLGTARSSKVEHATEVESSMLIPDFIIGFMIVLIGFVPVIFMQPLSQIIGLFSIKMGAIQQIIPILNNISISSGIFIMLIGLLWILRTWQQKRHTIKQNTTWACACKVTNPAEHQYTATSYANNFKQLSSKVVNVKKDFKDFDETEIFPKARKFETHSSDVFEDNLITAPTNKILIWFEKIAVLQTGKIQHYLLYALLFLVLIYLLTHFNLI